LPSTDENQKIHTNSFYDLLLKTIKDLNPIDRHNRKIFGEDVGLNLDLFCEKVTPNKQSAIYKILDFSKFKEISYNKSQIGSVKSPLDSQIALDYGFLIHKILEDSINTNNFDFTPIHPMIKMLGSNMQQSVCDKIVRLFNLPEFKLLFSDYKLYTEITVGTQEQTRNSIGRIDLLCINATNVVIVDYKTDIKLPKFIDEVPKKYIDQLKAYKIAIENIFPNQQISTKILWTEYETFMDIIILEHSPL
jgi:hypothetical protein